MAIPVGAFAEVHYPQRGFVLVLQTMCLACAWEPAAADVGRKLWAQCHVFIFLCWSTVTSGPQALAPLLFAQICTCWCPCTEIHSLRAGCQGQSREQLPSEQTSLLPQHPAFLSQFAPPTASPSSCQAKAKCPRCHRAHVLAVVSSTQGAVPPRAPQQSLFCW